MKNNRRQLIDCRKRNKMKRFTLLLVMVVCITMCNAQSEGVFNGISNSGNYYEKVLDIPLFPNGVPGLAIDVVLGNSTFWGNIELEITGAYYYQNTTGKLSKVFVIGALPDNNMYANESRVSEAMGAIVDNIAIGEFEWDATNTRYRIPVFHLTQTMNSYTIKIKALSHVNTIANIKTVLNISEQYSRTVNFKNKVNFNGQVGIGTANPDARLKIFAPTNGLAMGANNFVPDVNTMLQVNAEGNDQGSYIAKFGSYNAGMRMVIRSDGNVGVGTTSPTEKLAVDGNIKARKLIVTQLNWPDYVFRPAYQLNPLSTLAKFIGTNGHLPDMPSAKEVEKKGLDIGDNQALLLRKIEELTLYVIDLKKENEVQSRQINKQHQSIRQLQQRLTKK